MLLGAGMQATNKCHIDVWWCVLCWFSLWYNYTNNTAHKQHAKGPLEIKHACILVYSGITVDTYTLVASQLRILCSNFFNCQWFAQRASLREVHGNLAGFSLDSHHSGCDSLPVIEQRCGDQAGGQITGIVLRMVKNLERILIGTGSEGVPLLYM